MDPFKCWQLGPQLLEVSRGTAYVAQRATSRQDHIDRVQHASLLFCTPNPIAGHSLGIRP